VGQTVLVPGMEPVPVTLPVDVVLLHAAAALHEVLAPFQLVPGGDELRIDLGVLVGTPLEGEGTALAGTVEVGTTPVQAARHIYLVEVGAREQVLALLVSIAPIAQLPVPIAAIALGLFGRRAPTTHERLDLHAVGAGCQL